VSFPLKLDSAEDRQRQLTSLNNFDSIQCLSLMSDISTSEDRLYQVTRENTRIEMDRETDDITNLTKLGEIALLLPANTKQAPYKRNSSLLDSGRINFTVKFSMTKQLSGVVQVPWTVVRSGAGTLQVSWTVVRSGAGTLQVSWTVVKSGACTLQVSWTVVRSGAGILQATWIVV